MAQEAAATPTETGIRAYPPDGYYTVDAEEAYPCTCTPDCPPQCKGQCGCEACNCAYQDFLSCDWE